MILMLKIKGSKYIHIFAKNTERKIKGSKRMSPDTRAL